MNEKQEHYIQTGYYIIELIRSVLNEEQSKLMPKGITPKDIYGIAKRHNVDCIVYSALDKISDIELGEYAEKWKQRNLQCAMQGIVQLKERNRLYKMFTDAGIRILPLKGCLMKEMYPRQEYRQMADLDILIDLENAATVKELMEASGYEDESEFAAKHHDEYIKKPWCNVEIHKSMLPKKSQNAKNYENIWERAYEEQPGSGIYRLSWDDFYIYMIDHFAKHFFLSGSGIRSIMDISVFLKNKKEELHPEYLEEQFKKRKLWEFKETVEQIAEAWFEKGETKVFEETEARIIMSGAYGTVELNQLIYMENLTKKYKSKKIARLVRMGEMVFLEYDGMCVLYPVLKKAPFLLPFFWVHRILKVIFKKSNRIKEHLEKMRRL